MAEHHFTHLGVSIRDSDLARLSAREIGDIAHQLDGIADYWVIGADRSGTVVDPTVTAAAAARRTRSLGYVVAGAPHRDHPFNLARRLVSLDHATRGLAGWLALDDDPATALGSSIDPWTGDEPGVEHTRAAIAAVRELQQVWPLESVVADYDRQIFVDTERVRAADVDNRYRIAGPLPLPGPPQGQVPVLGHDESADLVIVGPDAADANGRIRLNDLDELSIPGPAEAAGVLIPVTLSRLPALLRIARAWRHAHPSAGITLRTRLGLPPAPGIDLHSRRRIFNAPTPTAAQL